MLYKDAMPRPSPRCQARRDRTVCGSRGMQDTAPCVPPRTARDMVQKNVGSAAARGGARVAGR
jgi:hypothetical protein